ncbi:hypothetical protein FO519_007194 [Halicephalobus sp. NKZ332]|nr:hypothetical protein FO519_007194 [Halicephalobus sp. NKZ332]
MLLKTSLIFLVGFLVGSEAAIGFDAIGSISTSTFTCLANAGHSFFVSRVYRSNGKIDTDGVQNIITARKAGFSDVDAYIFPCLSSSCPSAAQQVTDALNAINKAGATIGRLWLDVEILSWPSSTSSNQQFVLSMAQTAANMGASVGIYSNYNNWQSIVGANWNGVSQYPLWWARYNGATDLSTGWSAFGGWSSPTIHQYAGDTTQSEAFTGIDTDVSISETNFTCLLNAGQKFFIGRIYKGGKVDSIGIQNLVDAKNAKFEEIHGYFIPCLSSTCPSAVGQLKEAINAVNHAEVKIEHLWVVVEPPGWNSSSISNQQFILTIVHVAMDLGVSVGIYTNYNNWQNVVGANWNGTFDYALWWKSYNGVPDLNTGWVPFGGWISPTIHQYSESTQCGVKTNKNYKAG